LKEVTMQLQPIGNIGPREVFDQDRQAVTTSALKAAPTATEHAVAQAAPTPAMLNEAVRSINVTMRAMSQSLEFSVDDDSKRVIVKVVDQETKEVIRQMPSAEALEIAKALDRVQGLLIRQKA
jgi:flagellar protein FlaG